MILRGFSRGILYIGVYIYMCVYIYTPYTLWALTPKDKSHATLALHLPATPEPQLPQVLAHPLLAQVGNCDGAPGSLVADLLFLWNVLQLLRGNQPGHILQKCFGSGGL